MQGGISGKPQTGDAPACDWRLLTVPKITDVRGNLTFVELNRHIPFEIARVYYIYDVPSGSTPPGMLIEPCTRYFWHSPAVSSSTWTMDIARNNFRSTGLVPDCMCLPARGE